MKIKKVLSSLFILGSLLILPSLTNITYAEDGENEGENESSSNESKYEGRSNERKSMSSNKNTFRKVTLSTSEKNIINRQFNKIFKEITNPNQVTDFLNKIDNVINKTILSTKRKINVTKDIKQQKRYNKILSILDELKNLTNAKKTLVSNGNNNQPNISTKLLSPIQKTFIPFTHTAPNGDKYIIIKSNGKFIFKRSNGTYSNKSWNTSLSAIRYINKNAKKIVVIKPKPVVRVIPKPTPKLPVRVTPKPAVKVIPKPAVKVTPKPAVKVTPKPAINTVTSAS